jgi:thymidylate synthase (FAD)
MKVKLISYTSPSPELVAEGLTLPHELIAYCARISNPSNQMNHATADKLIAYLMSHKHFSPLEMVDLTMEISTTRDIARQALRHRSFVFQEFSQRYADPVKELEFVLRETRLQDPTNRQKSLPTDDKELIRWWEDEQRKLIAYVSEVYTRALSLGIAKEQARAVLPEGLTASRMYMKGSLRSWIHYFDVRIDESTQEEHRQIALACAKVIAEIFPIVNKKES